MATQSSDIKQGFDFNEIRTMKELFEQYVECLDISTDKDNIATKNKLEKYHSTNVDVYTYFESKHIRSEQKQTFIDINDFYSLLDIEKKGKSRLEEMFIYTMSKKNVKYDKFKESIVASESVINKYYKKYIAKDVAIGNMYLELGFFLKNFRCSTQDYDNRLMFYVLFNKYLSLNNKNLLEIKLKALQEEMAIRIFNCFVISEKVNSLLSSATKRLSGVSKRLSIAKDSLLSINSSKLKDDAISTSYIDENVSNVIKDGTINEDGTISFFTTEQEALKTIIATTCVKYKAYEQIGIISDGELAMLSINIPDIVYVEEYKSVFIAVTTLFVQLMAMGIVVVAGLSGIQPFIGSFVSLFSSIVFATYGKPLKEIVENKATKFKAKEIFQDILYDTNKRSLIEPCTDQALTEIEKKNNEYQLMCMEKFDAYNYRFFSFLRIFYTLGCGLDKDPSVSRAKEVLLNEPIADPEAQEETITGMATRLQERNSVETGIVQPSGDPEEDTTEETDEEKIEEYVNVIEQVRDFKTNLKKIYNEIKSKLNKSDADSFLSNFPGSHIITGGDVAYKDLNANNLHEKKIILIRYLKENAELFKTTGILSRLGITAPRRGGGKKNKTVRNKINKLKRRTYKKKTKPTRRKNYKTLKPSRKSFNKL